MPQPEGSPKLPPRRSSRRPVMIVGVGVAVIAIVILVAFLLFPDVLVNQFLKGRNISTFETTYPEYSLRIVGVGYNIFDNRVECDSLSLTPTDSGFSCTIAAFSVSGVGWLELLSGKALTPDFLEESELEAEDVVLTFPQQQYEILCGRLHISVSDSNIIAEDVRLHPIDDDDQFFASSRHRRTRYRLEVPHAQMMGSACLGFLRREMYCGRMARLRDPVLDILTDKVKSAKSDSTDPLMPNEVLASIKALLQIDSVHIVNGSLTYGERIVTGVKPAAITFDRMDVSIGGITNHCCDHDSTVLVAEGRFMNAGALKLRMAVPVAATEFSLRYSGSLGAMPLSAFNPFVKTAENVRIKSGALQTATFAVNVKSGRANGTIRAIYSDLAVATRDEVTGSEKGFLKRLESFVANTVKIRQNNLPDKSGDVKLGTVSYSREQDDTFFQFLWYSLRSGLKEIVGF